MMNKSEYLQKCLSEIQQCYQATPPTYGRAASIYLELLGLFENEKQRPGISRIEREKLLALKHKYQLQYEKLCQKLGKVSTVELLEDYKSNLFVRGCCYDTEYTTKDEATVPDIKGKDKRKLDSFVTAKSLINTNETTLKVEHREEGPRKKVATNNKNEISKSGISGGTTTTL